MGDVIDKIMLHFGQFLLSKVSDHDNGNTQDYDDQEENGKAEPNALFKEDGPVLIGEEEGEMIISVLAYGTQAGLMGC